VWRGLVNQHANAQRERGQIRQPWTIRMAQGSLVVRPTTPILPRIISSSFSTSNKSTFGRNNMLTMSFYQIRRCAWHKPAPLVIGTSSCQPSQAGKFTDTICPDCQAELRNIIPKRSNRFYVEEDCHDAAQSSGKAHSSDF